MQASELKFLLKLLGHPNYRASITQLNPNEQTKAPERNRICCTLSDRGWVTHSREVKKFKVSPAGKNLLKQDMNQFPLTKQHLQVLEACKDKSIVPSDVRKMAATERQSVIQDLEAKGLIQVEKVDIKEVWLTNQGQEYLRNQYNPGKSSATISLNLLNNYLKFIRKTINPVNEPQGGHIPIATEQISGLNKKLDDEEILDLIKKLDHEFGTENYLPIFRLRERLQLSLSRDEVDQALYRLGRQNKINLSSLVEAIHYMPEQIQAGISQPSGGPLFFIEVNQ